MSPVRDGKKKSSKNTSKCISRIYIYILPNYFFFLQERVAIHFLHVQEYCMLQEVTRVSKNMKTVITKSITTLQLPEILYHINILQSTNTFFPGNNDVI